MAPSCAQRYRDAVWTSKLSPLQRLVALCYADHAYGKDTAFVTYERLKDRTGVRSNETITTNVRQLVAAGWLEPVGEHRPRQRAMFRLTIPDPSAPVTGARSTPTTTPTTGAGSTPIHGPSCTDERCSLHRFTGVSAPVSGAHSLNTLGTSLKNPEREAVAAAATLRAATPPAQRNGGVPPPTNGYRHPAIAEVRERLPRGRSMSHWTIGTAPAGEPNPNYDPAALLAAQTAAPAWQGAEDHEPTEEGDQ